MTWERPPNNQHKPDPCYTIHTLGVLWGLSAGGVLPQLPSAECRLLTPNPLLRPSRPATTRTPTCSATNSNASTARPGSAPAALIKSQPRATIFCVRLRGRASLLPATGVARCGRFSTSAGIAVLASAPAAKGVSRAESSAAITVGLTDSTGASSELPMLPTVSAAKIKRLRQSSDQRLASGQTIHPGHIPGFQLVAWSSSNPRPEGTAFVRNR